VYVHSVRGRFVSLNSSQKRYRSRQFKISFSLFSSSLSVVVSTFLTSNREPVRLALVSCLGSGRVYTLSPLQTTFLSYSTISNVVVVMMMVLPPIKCNFMIQSASNSSIASKNCKHAFFCDVPITRKIGSYTVPLD